MPQWPAGTSTGLGALLALLGRTLVLEEVQRPKGAQVIVGAEDLAAVQCLLADPRAIAGAEVELAALGSGLGEPLPDPEQAEPVRAGSVFPEDEGADSLEHGLV